MPWSQVIDLRRFAGMPATESMTRPQTAAESRPSGSATGTRYLGLALDQRAHRGLALLSYDKIALPVAGHLAALGLGWALRDRRHPDNPGALRAGPASAQRDLHLGQLTLR